jgi:hypothetical protein
MQIIKNKTYEIVEPTLKIVRISYGITKETKVLSLIDENGTHYNLHRDELKLLLDFIREELK